MKPTYFDFTVKDLGATRRFFEQGFGWQGFGRCFEKISVPYEHYRIQTGDADKLGIDGVLAHLRTQRYLLTNH